MARPHISPADDLGLFLRIADHLEAGDSLRDIAEKLRITPFAVGSCIDRLESNYGGVTLVNRMQGSLKTTLTTSGRALHTRIKKCVDEPVQEASQIRVRISHSLLQSAFLSPLLIEWGLKQSHHSIDVRSSPDLNFEQEIDNILTGSLDLLIAWGLPNRLKVKSPGVEIIPVGSKFPLALISHDHQLLQQCSAAALLTRDFSDLDTTERVRHPNSWEPAKVNFQQVLQGRCAFLDVSKQPLGERLLQEGLYSIGNRRITVSSFHSVIDLVRARIADYGIIPVAGRDLDNLQLTRQLFYQTLDEPIDPFEASSRGIQIVVVRRNERLEKQHDRSELVDETVNSIKSFFNDPGEDETSQLAATALLDNTAVLAKLPTRDSAFFEKIRYGYYLWPISKSTHSALTGIEWQKEDVIIAFDRASPDLHVDSSRSRIVNDRRQIYRIDYSRILDGAFFFVANQQPAHEGDTNFDASRGFVGLFNACISLARGERTVNDFPSIMVGVWTGIAAENQIATWGLVFSEVPLSRKSLDIIAKRACLTYVLTSSSI